jgi:hypothetical protein
MRKTLLALPLLVATAAYGTPPPSHVARVRIALERIPVTAEDRVSETRPAELDALAASIAAASVKAPRSPVEWSSLLVAVGSHETNFAGRLLRGECRLERRECDATKGKDGKLYARARGWGQVWRNTLNADTWDAAETDIAAQTRLVDGQLRRAYWTCARSGVHWLVGTLNAYKGARCDATWPGLDKRVATFNAAVLVAVPRANGGAS